MQSHEKVEKKEPSWSPWGFKKKKSPLLPCREEPTEDKWQTGMAWAQGRRNEEHKRGLYPGGGAKVICSHITNGTCEVFEGSLLGFHSQHVVRSWHYWSSWSLVDVRICIKLSVVSLAPRTVDPTQEFNKLKWSDIKCSGWHMHIYTNTNI